MAAGKTEPGVFTIPAGVPFADALVTGLREMAGDDPRTLLRATVLLPTRRACRALHEAFLRQSENRALLLPRLHPLGDLDEDELAIHAPADETPPAGGEPFDLAPAISNTRRRLLLAKLIMARPDRDLSPDQASWLAAELATLLDQVHTERLGFDQLAELVPKEFAEHWRITLKFLEILTELWPAVLAEEGCLDPAERRNKLLEAQAELWRAQPTDDIVIAAGSTGSIPATAELLDVIATLPRGMVVLPGFDPALDPETIAALGPSHPQYGMAQLCARLGIEPARVTVWPHGEAAGSSSARFAWCRAALAPAMLTERKTGEDEDIAEAALEGLTWITCPTPQDEAGAVALLMRETLETPGKTAALITPDRHLARRVAAALKRWNVAVDDSAGEPLAQTPPGAFLRLVARLVADRFAPVSLLAALKHPLAAGGRAPPAFRRDVRRLEAAVLRGPRPAPGIEGLRNALKGKDETFDALLSTLERAAAGFSKRLAQRQTSLAHLIREHAACAEELATSDTEPGSARLWAGDAGETAARFVNELVESADALESLSGAAYPALFDSLIAGAVVRPRFGRHPRLFIWGLLEARLQQADVTILGGLNEGTWPPEAVASPWMSRPMLAAFGLPAPERRLGLTAHDFVQAFCAPRVVLTRAERVDGTPTLPARWLLRLENRLEAAGRKERVTRNGPWLDWNRRLDAPESVRQAAPPKPKPPVEARPRKLSVSNIETWIRDPYSIYARYVLGLAPLDPLDADPGAMERGILVHNALERFLRDFPGDLPADAERKLIAIGQDVFDAYRAWPGVHAFWWPRFERIAAWFVEFERERRAAGHRTAEPEAKGEMTFDSSAGPFVLSARADRIDKLADGTYAVLDYKTGQAASEKQIKSGLAPQLPLEAVMLEAGGFEDVAPGTVAALAYVRLTGGRDPGDVKSFTTDLRAVIEAAAAGLQKTIRAYDDANTPYLSRPRPMFAHRFAEYDHLARVKEWSSGDGEDS